MSILLPQRRRIKHGINIVPLIDVLIVLIFFILMTMQFKNINTLNITPPKMETAGNDVLTPESLSIAINLSGEYIFKDKIMTEEELKAALIIAGKEDAQQAVLVLADKEVALKYMTAVMDASRKAGLEKVRLQVKGE